MEIVEVRSILAALILFPCTAIKDHRLLALGPRNLWPLAGSGILSIVFFNYCYFSTISLMNLSAAAILLYTSPIFVMLMSLIFFHEQLTVRKVLALILAFAGCCLVSGLASAAVSLTAGGLLLGLGSGFGYALYSIFSRFSLNQGLHSITITNYTFLFAAIGGAFFTDFGQIADSLPPDTVLFAGLVGPLLHRHYRTALSTLYHRTELRGKWSCLGHGRYRTGGGRTAGLSGVFRNAHPLRRCGYGAGPDCIGAFERWPTSNCINIAGFFGKSP